jgi:hypothetical protein
MSIPSQANNCPRVLLRPEEPISPTSSVKTVHVLFIYRYAVTLLPGILTKLLRSAFVCLSGQRGSVMVKALSYKPEGRGFDTRRGEFLNLPNPSSGTRPWGLLSV